MKQYRYIILLFFIAGLPGIKLYAQPNSLEVDIGDDSLRISARQSHFLSDRELERLHNGLSVTLTIDLVVVTEHSDDPLYRVRERFVFSFDLWEEKYSVFHSSPKGRYVSHLSAASAEEWCLENMSVPLDIIPDSNAFMIQLECFIGENEKDTNTEDAPGLTITRLIEYFSRKKTEEPHHWRVSSGFLQLNELKKTEKAP